MTRMTRDGHLPALVTAFAVAVCVPAGPSAARTAEAEGFKVIHPWTEPAGQGQATNAYPTLVGKSGKERALTGVSSDVAERVEIVIDGEAVDRLTVPAGNTRGSERFHLRLTDLNRELEAGGHFEATLRFANGQTEAITMVVGESTTAPEGKT